MVEIRTTRQFDSWPRHLRDEIGRGRIRARMVMLAKGHSGDFRWVGESVLEMRIHFGPGYRVYYTRRGAEVIILLAGGDKKSQAADIRLAIRLARELEG